MTIRSAAMAYFQEFLARRSDLAGAVARNARGRLVARTSRRYGPGEAFPRRTSWWHVIQASDLNCSGSVALVSETSGSPPFHVHLVPTTWLAGNRSSLAHEPGRDVYHIWLAADGPDRFHDLRGGVLDFSPWLVGVNVHASSRRVVSGGGALERG